MTSYAWHHPSHIGVAEQKERGSADCKAVRGGGSEETYYRDGEEFRQAEWDGEVFYRNEWLQEGGVRGLRLFSRGGGGRALHREIVRYHMLLDAT